MLHSIKVYFATLPIFLAIDFFWLGFLMSKFYKTELGTLSRGASGSYQTVWWAAAIGRARVKSHSHIAACFSWMNCPSLACASWK